MQGSIVEAENQTLPLFIKHLTAYCERSKNLFTKQTHTKVVQNFIKELEQKLKSQTERSIENPRLLILALAKYLQQEQKQIKQGGALFKQLLEFLQESQAYPKTDLSKMLRTMVCHDKEQEALNQKLLALVKDNGDLATITTLLDQGANPNQTLSYLNKKTGVSEQINLLSLACIQRYELAEILLMHGAEPEFRDPENRSTLSYLLSSKGFVYGQEYMFQSYSDEELLAQFNLTQKILDWEISGRTRFIQNRLKPFAYLMELIKLLSKYDADISATSIPEKNTALHWLCASPVFSYENAQFLLEKGIDPLQKNHGGHLAFAFLPEYGTISIEEKYKWLNHCFSTAIILYDTAMITAVLQKKPIGLANLNVIDAQGLTAIHLALLHNNREAAVLILALPHFTNVNTQTDGFQITPLHSALHLNYFDITIQLLQKGADPTIENRSGETALDLLVQKNLITPEEKNVFLEHYLSIKSTMHSPPNGKTQALKAHINALIQIIETSMMSQSSASTLTTATPFLQNLHSHDSTQSHTPENHDGDTKDFEQQG